jgi:membrane-associated phospholipid phosphatase
MMSLPAPLLILLRWDEALFRFINSHHSVVFDVLFWICSTLGSGWGLIPAYLVFILLTAKKSRVRAIIVASAVTLLAGGILSTWIKMNVDRPRPTIYFKAPPTDTPLADMERAFAVHNFGPRYRTHSFPSGHTWTAFAVATLMMLFFGRKYWWTYLIAAMIGYSRAYLGVHFPLDVLAGALCGTLLAFLVWRVTARIRPHLARPQS